MFTLRSPRAPRFRPHLEALETREVLSGVQPSALDQVLLEELNDARANPAAYGQSIGLDLSGVAPSQPLAWNTNLIQAAEGHSQDMNARNYFNHITPDGLDPSMRITAAGFAATSWGESIAAGYTSPAAALAGLIIDNGVSNLGHRRHLLAIDATFRDQNAVGIGILMGGSGTYQNYFTIDTAEGSDTRPYLTGVVYNDLNGNGQYDAGEGLGGVTVTVQGAGAVTTFGSGGYSLQVSPGTYTVTFSGGGLSGTVTQNVSVGATNYRLNATAAQATTQAAGSASNTDWLTQVYQSLLGRTPGQADFNFWLPVLQGGTSRDAVLASITASPEYHNVDNTRWVADIFPALLGRAASAGDLNWWVPLLGQGVSRDGVVGWLMTTPEYRRQEGAQWLPGVFEELLGRTPGTADMSFWLNVLGSGATHQQVIAAITTSPEFLGKASNQPAAWLDLVYQDLLGRHAVATDLNFWLGAMNSGYSFAGVALGIMQSTEYQGRDWNAWVMQLYQNLLGRNPSGSDLTYWYQVWQFGGTRPAVLNIFLNSAEFKNRASPA